MDICTDGCKHGRMIDSAALMQGLRRLQEAHYCLTLPPRPCPARKPAGNNFKTIIKARLGRSLRRWRR